MTRRKFIQSTALAAAASPLLAKVSRADSVPSGKLKGNIRQSACRWCYKNIKLEELCAAGKEMGLVAIDLLQPSDFATVKKDRKSTRLNSSH